MTITEKKKGAYLDVGKRRDFTASYTKKAMKLGTFTVALGHLAFEEACAFLAENGVQMVEIGCGGFPGKAHCDAKAFFVYLL